MNNEIKNQFEDEYILYVSNELPEKRMRYWDEQIKKYPELEQYIAEYNEILTLYDAQEIPEPKPLNFQIITTTGYSELQYFGKRLLKNTRLIYSGIAASIIIALITLIGLEYQKYNDQKLYQEYNELTLEINQIEYEINVIRSQLNQYKTTQNESAQIRENLQLLEYQMKQLDFHLNN